MGVVRLDFGTSMWTGSPIWRGDQAPLRAVAAGGDHGHHRGGAPGDAVRGPRRAQAGHLGGLRRPHLLDRGPGDAVVLARHPVHPHVPDRLQVAAAHGLHPVLGEPVAEHAAARLAGARGRLPLLGGGDPHDPLRHARGAARGLHADRAGQGARPAPDPGPPRAQERDAAGADRDRARVRLPHRRARRDRAGLQPERDRAALRAGGGPPRLHADPGPRDAGRRASSSS